MTKKKPHKKKEKKLTRDERKEKEKGGSIKVGVADGTKEGKAGSIP